MKLTFMTDDDQYYNVDVDPELELENLVALLEDESKIPAKDQVIYHDGKEVQGDKTTLQSHNFQDGDLLRLSRKMGSGSGQQSGRGTGGGGNPSGVQFNQGQMAQLEMARQQLLSDPNMLAQIRIANPQLAEAVQSSDPTRFYDLFSQFLSRQMAAGRGGGGGRGEDPTFLNAYNEDPNSEEVQNRIAEEIRMKAVYENRDHAMEYNPEAFGRVTMLYVDLEVNGKKVKAFVDSGAQATIMSPQCAEDCGIMRLLDTDFAGMAMGVGTAKILGRVHAAQIKVADLHLACSFTIMESSGVDMLFGLDMLKRHQATIDLQKNALVIQGREIPFLPEHEIPNKGQEIMIDENGNPIIPPNSGFASAPSSALGAAAAANTASKASSFPGSGNTLGTTPASSSSSARPQQTGPAGGSRSRFREEDILTLMGLGMGRDEAVALLEASGGNPEVAAASYFG